MVITRAARRSSYLRRARATDHVASTAGHSLVQTAHPGSASPPSLRFPRERPRHLANQGEMSPFVSLAIVASPR